MIEEPPLLRILTAPKRNRPTPQQIAAFRDVPSGNICDAMGGNGALDMAIKPLPGLPERFCGPALTADNGPADILGLAGALEEAMPGDVIVNAVDGWQGCAALGDMVVGMAKNGGVAALVTDGPARDLAGIVPHGLPVFATGLNPNSPYGKGPGKVGYPVHIGGRRVASGDIVVGDRDGVVVVPFDEIDRIIGLELGADDYMPKPFNPRELLARIKAVLRRRVQEAPGAPSQEENVISFGDYQLNLATREMLKGDVNMPLTSGEFAVLKALITHPREPLSRDKLMNLARGRDYSALERSIDVQVSRLRRMLEEDPAKPRYIQTVWGLGYVFVPEGKSVA